MHSVGSPFFWTLFAGLVVFVTALDLGVFNRKAHSLSMREAAAWSAVWVSLALGFNAFVWRKLGAQSASEFLQAWLLEQSLSVDNLFVFLVIFQQFRVPPELRRRVLVWGILGAVITRGIFIGAGVALVHQFTWLMYVFGAILLYTAVKLIREEDGERDFTQGIWFRGLRRFFPMSSDYDGDKFFVKRGGRTLATPLFAVLIIVEGSDVTFATDSIPAVFGVTTDLFIVYTSNIFAILGLRSFLFLLAGLMASLHYLKIGLAVILAFIGFKILLVRWVHVPTAVSLGVLAGIIVLSAVASFAFPKKGD